MGVMGVLDGRKKETRARKKDGVCYTTMNEKERGMLGGVLACTRYLSQ